ncbi:hypothetical protein BU23DRAFT_481331 [Bimuria novae-zelandiae CBS 107.79]|uniref:Atos-like conserved domain-containing protein n=1 Tax=Bimuria novae-zelandiae CBS 107.79 TaxID=1447943 RepID=A0A6A5UTF5_9PLEO|nr:hypothetical protein BU23DRAFT_481331 [Bimuria novae-zelandiae CBS 107.79]
MPIFHESDESRPHRPAPQVESSLDATESVWKHAHGYERPRLGHLSSGLSVPSASTSDVEAAFPNHLRSPPLLDRVELIERLKLVNSPPWQHSTTKSRPSSQDRPKTPLLSPPRNTISRPSTPDPLRDNASAGLEIARPRSALHSGDFREKKEGWDQRDGPASSGIPLATSPVVPWHHSFPTATLPSDRAQSPPRYHEHLSYKPPYVSRARAVSQSSFAFLPPTSPLVQQSNNTDLDSSSRPSSRQTSRSPERTNRRHTFSPRSFSSYKSSDVAASASGTPAARHMRKSAATPYQAHQPRRSLTSFNHFKPHSSPQTPLLGSRRPSFSSEASPLHHAPMVGSYEESILRGRMSTAPSRPLDFIAKIGVLGRAQCNSNLKCPPHVAVPFPAVFYSYNTGNGRISDDSPSPYVGLVDLENSIAPPDESTELSKRRRRHTVPDPGYEDLDFRIENDEDGSENKTRKDLRRKEKKKRRSTSPKAPPGGSYRIPQQGQLQIVIKNPNKTAVKLFLVPYDLSDMEPGQKTFIRQRSYSAGPIIDMPLSSRNNLGTDRPEASLSHSDDPNDRPILRYLIHLYICCPSKGRFYLYKSIRVVFANRVPDGKEKLRNEIQMPEPRYSTYKATRDSLVSQAPSSAAAQLAAEKAMRRRSAGVSLSHQSHSRTEGLSARHRPQLSPPAVRFTGSPSPNTDFGSPASGMGPIPFALTRMPSIPSRPVSREFMDVDPASPFRPQSRNEYTSPMTPRDQTAQSPASFEKLNKGDVGYGGSASPGLPGAGLLARRLRGLDVEPDDEHIY